MKALAQTLIHWLPFAFAVYLCYSAMWRVSGSDMKALDPVFYSFLPMCFFFGGLITFRLAREIRDLRSVVAKLQAKEAVDRVAA